MIKNYLTSSLLCLILTLAYDNLLYHQTGWTFVGGALYFFIVLGAYNGGFVGGLLSASWAAIYAYYATSGDPSLWIERSAWGFMMAGLVGALCRRERIKRELLNTVLATGNVEKIRLTLGYIRELKRELSQNEWATRLVGKAESELGNLLAISDGFSHMWQEIQAVEKWYRKPGNIGRWRKWRDSA